MIPVPVQAPVPEIRTTSYCERVIRERYVNAPLELRETFPLGKFTGIPHESFVSPPAMAFPLDWDRGKDEYTVDSVRSALQTIGLVLVVKPWSGGFGGAGNDYYVTLA
jgi:hypothetical protein